VKVSFETRKIAKVFMTHVQVFFRKSLSKATFERKLSSVSLALQRRGALLYKQFGVRLVLLHSATSVGLCCCFVFEKRLYYIKQRWLI